MGRWSVPRRSTITAGLPPSVTSSPARSATAPPWPSRCTAPSRPWARPTRPTTIFPGRQGVSAGDFDMHAPPALHGRRLDDRAERAGDAALLADHLADVVGGDVQLEHELPRRPLVPLDAHLVGVVDELAGQVREELF